MNEPICVSVYKDTFLKKTRPNLSDDEIASICDCDNIIDIYVKKSDLISWLNESDVSLDWYFSEHTAVDNEGLIPWLISHNMAFKTDYELPETKTSEEYE